MQKRVEDKTNEKRKRKPTEAETKISERKLFVS